MRRIFDISPPITEALAVWPGDTPLRREVLLDMNRGDNITLSSSGLDLAGVLPGRYELIALPLRLV